MSETLSQDPESLGSAGYTTLTSSYPPTPATPSSTVQDAPPPSVVNLPPFSTFSADMDAGGGGGFVTDRLFAHDSRLLDVSNWDYYTETRLLERSENGLSIISSQPQYRPWESKPVDSSSQTSFTEAAFGQNGVPKLPSFQSQFQTFNESTASTEPTTLTTLTNLTPVSPNSSSPPGSQNLTTLNSNFHTFTARNYPLVPAPIQAREIPSIQQQFLDERHIQLYTHPTTNLATLANPGGIFAPQNGAIIQGGPTVVTVLKTDQDLKVQGLHPAQFQNPLMDNGGGLYNGLDRTKLGSGSPTRSDFRKKERRKIRASSLESSAESDGASMDVDSGQVAAVSSTAPGFKHHGMNPGVPATAVHSEAEHEISGGNVQDKQVKKKRKRCGECIGCQRKDNCGDCAPCRNDKSHQICKQRRCEKLTEKKNLYGDQSYLRGESRRGRGKGRGAGSYRGRKPSGPVVTPLQGGAGAASSVSVVQQQQQEPPPSRPSPQPAQPVHMLKPDQQQQPMAPMPFYADPNRFPPTPVWQADPAQAWAPQGQFIQQIPVSSQPNLEGYAPQQYTPNGGIYQATYQQSFDGSNTFYTGAVQVLARPPSAPSHPQLTPRTNGNYSHTPSPVATQQTPSAPQGSRQYHQDYAAGSQNYIPPASTPGMESSRPSSVNSSVASSTGGGFSQNGPTYTSVANTDFSPSSGQQGNYAVSNNNSGNGQPGYPQVNSSPQLVSLNSSGCPGSSHYSGNTNEQQSWEQEVTQHQPPDNHLVWEQQQQQQRGESKEAVEASQQSDRVNLNTRLKTMILNKQQSVENKVDESQKLEQNQTGHFLSYSHHHRLDRLDGDGGRKNRNFHCDTGKPKNSYYPPPPPRVTNKFLKPTQSDDDNLKVTAGIEIPPCQCFPQGNLPPEPGTYYTHLGCASDLKKLRKDFEGRTGLKNEAIRIEKVRYTGKEGRTSEGCPVAKWILRRSSYAEKVLVIVKHRTGHFCESAFIVICMVAWEGVGTSMADILYHTLTDKLNKFGRPTMRRCATNEQKTCACQGLDPNRCGANFSFGCSWSMFYNGCKFARSRVVRKFRLSEESEEKIVEDKMHELASHLSPLYKCLAPVSFNNQCKYEHVASDCRLGTKPGRPFSGVTACLDFCAHAHKDSHNMSEGCTVVVTLKKNTGVLGRPDEQEQLHVLPMYIMDETDEFGSREKQVEKMRDGSIQVLDRYHSEVRVRSERLQPCRRAKKKKRDEEASSKDSTMLLPQVASTYNGIWSDEQLQSDHISSTVQDSPSSQMRYERYSYGNYQTYQYGSRNSYAQILGLPVDNAETTTAFRNVTYPITNYSSQPYHCSPADYQPPTYFQNTAANLHSGSNCSESANLPNFYETQTFSVFPGVKPLGEITNYTDNLECFKDSQIGGVALALTHGSVMFECAKHEVHATTALKKPDRTSPTRISLVFYQHRNLNKSRHGWDEYDEKMRLRKLGNNAVGAELLVDTPVRVVQSSGDVNLPGPTMTTTTVTTLFPMYPCIVTGPYQEKSGVKK